MRRDFKKSVNKILSFIFFVFCFVLFCISILLFFQLLLPSHLQGTKREIKKRKSWKSRGEGYLCLLHVIRKLRMENIPQPIESGKSPNLQRL